MLDLEPIVCFTGAEEEVGESENEEEDIFELEGQTEHLHLGTPRHAEQEAAARQSRGGWEGAATGEAACLAVMPCGIWRSCQCFGTSVER